MSEGSEKNPPNAGDDPENSKARGGEEAPDSSKKEGADALRLPDFITDEDIRDLFSQPDIDALLDGQDIDALLGGAVDAPTDMDVPILPEGEVPISQADIDALLSGDQADESADSEGGEGGPGGLVGQADIDALLAGAADVESESLEDEGGAVDQSEIDALLAGAADAGTAKGEEEAGGAIGQSEIDALLSGAGAGAAEGEEETGGGAVDQSEIDALLAGGGAGTADAAAAKDEDEAGGAIGQSEIDALLSGAGAGAVEGEDEAGGAVDQSEIDALLSGAGAGTAEGEEDAGGAVDQSEIDALLAGGGTEAADAGGGDEEDVGGVIGQDDIDALLAGAQKEEPAASARGKKPGARETRPGAAEAETGERDSGVDQSEIDELLAGLSAGEDEDVSIPSDDELAAALGEPGLEDVGDVVPSADIPDLVSSENVAAAVPTDDLDATLISQEMVDSLAAEVAAAPDEVIVPSDDEFSAELGEAPPSMPETDVTEMMPPDVEDEAPPKRAWIPALPGLPALPTDLLGSARPHLARIVTSVVVGLVFTAATYAFLRGHAEEKPVLRVAPGRMQTADVAAGIDEARDLVRRGRYAEALDQIDRLLSRAPAAADTREAEFLRIEASYKLLPESIESRQTEPIHAAIDRFIDKAPDYPRVAEALLWKADLYERCDVPYAARAVYDRLLTNFAGLPNVDEVLFAAAKLNCSLRRFSEARDQLGRLLKGYPGSPLAGEARLLTADTYLGSGNREAAQRVLQQLAQLQPNTRLGARALMRLGQMALEEGKYPEAIRLFETRLETATSIEGNDKVYVMLAQAYRDVGRPEDAERILRELIDFFPESSVTPDALVLLSQVVAQHGKRTDALQIAAQAAQRYPDSSETVRNYADMLIQAGRSTAAVEALLGPDLSADADPETLLKAGRLLRESLEFDNAKNILKRLLKEYPSADQAFDGKVELAKVYYDDDNPKEAVQTLEEMVLTTEDPIQRLPVLTTLGDMYEEQGAVTRAGQLYAAAAQVTNDPQVLYEAAMALFDSGNWEDAIAVANRINPASLPAASAYALLNKQGQALLRVDAAKALDKMEQAYESYPAERTADAEYDLLKTYLAVGRFARARAIVSDIEAYVRSHPVDSYRLQRAAVAWADDLFERSDYRAAAQAYETALEAMTGAEAEADWARFQRANALFKANDLDAGIPLLDEIAASTSPYAAEAAIASENARLEQRLRGQPVTPKPAEG